MHGAETRFIGTIPANYTDSKFPLQYYFELRRANDAWLFLGLETIHRRSPISLFVLPEVSICPHSSAIARILTFAIGLVKSCPEKIRC
jgi:hypothetical protein